MNIESVTARKVTTALTHPDTGPQLISPIQPSYRSDVECP